MIPVALIALYGVENTGIRSIASVLARDGFPVTVIFFKRWVNNDIRYPSSREIDLLLGLLAEHSVRLVGVSFTSPFLGIARDITAAIKRRTPDTTVVWGGVHATVEPEACLKYCDAVCRGEGEYAMRDFAAALSRGAAPDGVPNWCTRTDGKMACAPVRPPLDLDELPLQSYNNGRIFFIEGTRQDEDPLLHAREIRAFASRGCPFECSYCYNSILGKIYPEKKFRRAKKVDTVIKELHHALGHFPRIKTVKFDDDTFVFPKYWIQEFCRKYKQEIGLPFEILLNAQCYDAPTLAALRQAGLRRVQMGIQTVSDHDGAQIYNRTLSLETIRDFSVQAHHLKIETVYDVILDNPLARFSETREMALYLLSLPRPFDLFLYSLTVFPGTALCETLLKNGSITPAEIEGEAQKSFTQFRLNFSYPRKKEDLFLACAISLTSKAFLPRRFIRSILNNGFLRHHPFLLRILAEAGNGIKLAGLAIKMAMRGELTLWKIMEYGTWKRTLIQ